MIGVMNGERMLIAQRDCPGYVYTRSWKADPRSQCSQVHVTMIMCSRDRDPAYAFGRDSEIC